MVLGNQGRTFFFFFLLNDLQVFLLSAVPLKSLKNIVLKLKVCPGNKSITSNKLIQTIL